MTADAAGVSERERLLTAFFAAAAAEGEWVRDWANADGRIAWDHPKAGDEVQMDGDFNIWAGIQAVVAQAKAEALEEAAAFLSKSGSPPTHRESGARPGRCHHLDDAPAAVDSKLCGNPCGN